jgi:hypothetical protein
MKDEEVRARIVSLAGQGLNLGHADVLNLYGELVVDRGKNCADHFITVIQFSARGAVPTEINDAVTVLIRSHPTFTAKKTKTGVIVATGIVIGAGGAGFVMSDPIIRVFASVGIIGAVLLAVIILFKEPLGKAAFSKLNGAQTERIFGSILKIIAAVTILAVLGGIAVAVIQALRRAQAP